MAVGSCSVWITETVGCRRGLTWDSSCLTSLSTTWRTQEKALLWGLQMTPDWRDQAIGRRAGWRDRLAWMLLVIDGNKAVLSVLYKQRMWYKMYRSFSAFSRSFLYSAALLVSCCILFNLFLQVDYWALTSAKGQETSLHRTIFISAFSMLLFPFLSLRPW